MLQLCACASQAVRIFSPEALLAIILNILHLNLKDSRAQSFYLWLFTMLPPPSHWMIKERESLWSRRPARWVGGEDKCTMPHNSLYSGEEKQLFFSLTRSVHDRGLPFNLIKETHMITCKMLAKFKYVSLINYHLLHKTVIVHSLKPHWLIPFCPVH